MEGDSEELDEDQTARFRSSVLTLLYLSNEQTDIQSTVRHLCTKLQNPTALEMSQLKRLFSELEQHAPGLLDLSCSELEQHAPGFQRLTCFELEQHAPGFPDLTCFELEQHAPGFQRLTCSKLEQHAPGFQRLT